MHRHASQHNLPFCEQGRQKYSKRAQSSSQINVNRVREIRVNLCPTKSSIKREINDNFQFNRHYTEEPITHLETDNEMNKKTDNESDEIDLLKVHLNECQINQDKINNNNADTEIEYCNKDNLVEKGVQTNLAFNKDSTIVAYQHDRFFYRFHSYQSKLMKKLVEKRNKDAKSLKSTGKSKSTVSITRLNSKMSLRSVRSKIINNKMKISLKQWKSNTNNSPSKKSEVKSKYKQKSIENECPKCEQNETGLRFGDVLYELSFILYSLAVACVSFLITVTVAITLMYIISSSSHKYFTENTMPDRSLKENNEPYYVFKFNQFLTQTIGYELKVAD